MNYGEVVLGVECALPAGVRLAPERSLARRVADWLGAILIART